MIPLPPLSFSSGPSVADGAAEVHNILKTGDFNLASKGARATSANDLIAYAAFGGLVLGVFLLFTR